MSSQVLNTLASSVRPGTRTKLKHGIWSWVILLKECNSAVPPAFKSGFIWKYKSITPNSRHSHSKCMFMFAWTDMENRRCSPRPFWGEEGGQGGMQNDLDLKLALNSMILWIMHISIYSTNIYSESMRGWVFAGHTFTFARYYKNQQMLELKDNKRWSSYSP